MSPDRPETSDTRGLNHHACAVCVDKTGILIEGRSGSGKTSLAHGLIDRFSALEKPAVWVSDDQVLLEICSGMLRAHAPAAIAGKAELRGFGIISVGHVPFADIELVVRLVADEHIERMPEAKLAKYELAGTEATIPVIEVPSRHESQAIRLVCAKLSEMGKAVLPLSRNPALAPGVNSMTMNARKTGTPNSVKS